MQESRRVARAIGATTHERLNAGNSTQSATRTRKAVAWRRERVRATGLEVMRETVKTARSGVKVNELEQFEELMRTRLCRKEEEANEGTGKGEGGGFGEGAGAGGSGSVDTRAQPKVRVKTRASRAHSSFSRLISHI